MHVDRKLARKVGKMKTKLDSEIRSFLRLRSYYLFPWFFDIVNLFIEAIRGDKQLLHFLHGDK